MNVAINVLIKDVNTSPTSKSGQTSELNVAEKRTGRHVGGDSQ